MKKKLSLLASAVVFAAGSTFIVSCGENSNQSSVQSNVVPVSTKVAVDFDLQDSRSNYISREEIQLLAQQLLAERLRGYDLIPSQLPEFFQFALQIDRLEGCEGPWSVCDGNFSFNMKLSAVAGPDELDEVSRRVSLTSLNRSDLRRRMDWTVKLLLEVMVQHGVLIDLGVETPHF